MGIPVGLIEIFVIVKRLAGTKFVEQGQLEGTVSCTL